MRSEALGGSIEVELRAGRGTTARVDARRGGEPVTTRILLVDDEPDLLQPVGYTLRQQGFEVDTAGDGNAALELARSGAYDLLICDVMMPGMLGTDVCRTLRAESDLPIILLTARDAEVDSVLGLELGADDYITKPFSSADLVSRVRSLLRRRYARSRARSGANTRRWRTADRLHPP